MIQEETITLGNLMYDTLITGIIMVLFVGGFGLIGIIKSLKDGVMFSKEELFKKGDFYTNLQMLLAGLGLLSFSLWYNIYKGYLFTYLAKIQLFFTSKNFNNIDINGI